MIRHTQLSGVIAALLLPRDEEGRPAWEAFDRNARFVLRAGVAGLCVNGATGEFAGATADERREVVVRARQVAGRSGLVVSGVGATRWTEVLALARDAEDAGADALLVPAPHFFTYAPGDLAEFYRRIAAEAHVPILIYNLPAFTGSLDPELAMRLIREVEGIVGAKDSSGELELLEEITATRDGRSVALVGNDGVLAKALERGVCGGTVSGVAGVVPELTLALWRGDREKDRELFATIGNRLQELLRQLDAFPVPWGLKLIAELRGLGPASFAFPLSAERRRQADEFRRWFPAWWREAEEDLARALPAGQPGCGLT